MWRLGVDFFKVVILVAKAIEIFVGIVILKFVWLVFLLMTFVGWGVRGVALEKRLRTES